MNDRRPPQLDDERLSAYLAGELSDDEVIAFEEQLAADPDAAARLDRLANALVALGAVDDATPPEGFDERLRERIAAESTVDDLSQHRAQRAQRSNRWMGISAAAAVVVLGAVMATSVLDGMGGMGGRDEVAMESADTAGTDAAAGPPSGPVILTDDPRVAGQAALRDRYADLPEVQALLGVPVDEAVQVAAEYSAAVPETDQHVAALSEADGDAPAAGAAAPEQEAAKDDSGATAGGGADDQAESTEAAAGGEPTLRRDLQSSASSDYRAGVPGGLRNCLEVITAGAAEPLVPARIETLRYDGRAAFAYVFVTAEPAASRLNRTEVWVVARADCATLVFQQF